MQVSEKQILDGNQVNQKIVRMAYGIHEDNFKQTELIFAGIDPTGYVLAKELAAVVESISDIKTTLVKVSLDKRSPLQSAITLDTPVEVFKDKAVILCDDVLNSGRTLAYALKPFLNCDVAKLQVAVIVDRGYSKFPIRADFTGYALSTTIQEHVRVALSAADKNSWAVYLS